MPTDAELGVLYLCKLNNIKRTDTDFRRYSWGRLPYYLPVNDHVYFILQKWVLQNHGDVFNAVKRIHSRNPTTHALGYKYEST